MSRRLDLATRQEIAREVYGPLPTALLAIAVLRVAAVEDLLACHVKPADVERIAALVRRAQDATIATAHPNPSAPAGPPRPEAPDAAGMDARRTP